MFHGWSNSCRFTGFLDFGIDTFKTMDKLYFRKELYKFLADSRNFSNYMFPDEPLCSVQLWSCTCRGVGWTVYCRSWSSPPPLVKLPGAFLWTSWHPGVGSIVDSSDPHIHGLMRNSFLVHPETILSIRLVEKKQLYLILGKPPNSPKIWNIENFHILTLWKISTPFILTFKKLIYLVCSMSHDILGSDNLHIIVNVPDALCWTD